MAATDKGSVITIDAGVGILAKHAALGEFIKLLIQEFLNWKKKLRKEELFLL
jgi:hypothetical protein